MKLSIIIVNYNVCYFLEQTLSAVYKSETAFDYEVWVVDNDSKDESLMMIEHKFPKVNLIANKANVGFAKANNQAIQQAQGEYVLLLNPDTIIQEDTLQRCVEFMDSHADAGGLGVKMYDGTGNFLPESKRGFPSPLAAFAKMSGLAKLFPKSKIFGGYHLTYLDKNKTHQVDVLSGAFMFIRKIVLDKIGLLDEEYFMYGEDIDLSYRIQLAGYSNYYFADTAILHFKGESTKKGSLNYVRVFYTAMLIFTKKHISGAGGKLLSVLLRIAIYFRAFIALKIRVMEKIGAPVFDAVFMVANLYVLQLVWENYIRFAEHVSFPLTYFYINVPIYVGCWLFALWLNGVYDKQAKWLRLLSGLSVGTILISIVYAFFPDYLRTSRGVILVGFITNFLFLFLFRLIYRIGSGSISGYFSDIKNMLIVGNQQEANAVWSFIQTTGLDRRYIGYLSDDTSNADTENYVGKTAQLEEVVHVLDVDEVIYCSNVLNGSYIIQTMSKMGNRVEYKIASAQSTAIIGSNSKDTAGDLYTLDIGYNLNKPLYLRLKRLTDIAISILGLLLYPLIIFFVNRSSSFAGDCYRVLIHRNTWVGYDKQLIRISKLKFPPLIDAVYAVSDRVEESQIVIKEKLHVFYAKDYSPLKDIVLIYKFLFR